jgi:hypothetical protein
MVKILEILTVTGMVVIKEISMEMKMVITRVIKMVIGMD